MGPVAQWLEQAAHNGLVAGSSPAGPTKLFKDLCVSSRSRLRNRKNQESRRDSRAFYQSAHSEVSPASSTRYGKKLYSFVS